MKLKIFIIIILFISKIHLIGFTKTNINITTSKGKKIHSLYLAEVRKEKQVYLERYEETLDIIKKAEGFRSDWYLDGKFLAIGYGQRRACFRGIIKAPITESQADSILRLSFNAHLKDVRVYYPKLNDRERLSVGHISYCIGLGRVNQLKLIRSNKLDSIKLMRLPYKWVRKFEINMFYNKI